MANKEDYLLFHLWLCHSSGLSQHRLLDLHGVLALTHKHFTFISLYEYAYLIFKLGHKEITCNIKKQSEEYCTALAFTHL